MEIPGGRIKATGRTVAYGIDIEDGPTCLGCGLRGGRPHGARRRPRLADQGWRPFRTGESRGTSAGAHVDIRVTLASPTLTAKLCAPLNTSTEQVSCWNGTRAVLNLTRWIRGAGTYGNDLASYRDYLVSHEVGHGLGHGHVHCPGAGQPSPVMVAADQGPRGLHRLALAHEPLSRFQRPTFRAAVGRLGMHVDRPPGVNGSIGHPA